METKAGDPGAFASFDLSRVDSPAFVVDVAKLRANLVIQKLGRDYARFGELYRLDGVWKGRRILPKGWVKFARTPTVEPTYGAGFWLEAPAGAKPPSLMAGAGPLDAFSAQGHDGQIIMIVPSKALVIVRLALMDDGDAAWKALGEWLTPVVNAFPAA